MTHLTPEQSRIVENGKALLPELIRLDEEIKKTWAFWTSRYGDKFDEEGNKTAQRAYETACHSFSRESHRQSIIAALSLLDELANE